MDINNKLIEQWEPKINRMLQTTSIRGMDREDIAQELRISILKAAKGFDPSRKVSFHTYLHTTMINTIRTLITKAQRRPEPQSLDKYLSYDSQEMSGGLGRGQWFENKALSVNVDMDSDLMLQSSLDHFGFSSTERLFLTLRMESLTMDEITNTIHESSYKIRTQIRQKLGRRNEKRVLLWLNGMENS